MKRLAVSALLLASLGLGSCASLPGRDGPPAPVVEAGRQTRSGVEATGIPPVSAPRSAPLQRSPLPDAEPVLGLPAASPAAGLLAEVDAAMATGDLERAAAVCERALRIAPREGVLWLRLSVIRFRQERFSEALGFAQRAESLAAGDARLLRESRLMQERIRQQGDS